MRIHYCFKTLLVLTLGVTLLTACSWFSSNDDARYKGLSQKQLFIGGERALAKGEYAEAITYYEQLQADYPFGITTKQAQLELIYAYYKNGDSASAAAAAAHYVHLYPRSKNAAYAYYMKGLASFNQNQGWLSKMVRLDRSQRDMSSMRDSYNDFMTVLQFYPNSKYAHDARQHLLFLRSVLAKHELLVAQYYFKRQAYVAAANRASFIVQHYQHAGEVEPALKLMIAAYNKLGETKLATDAQRVLKANFS